MNVALNRLLDGIAELPGNEVHVSELTLDSRAVRDGSLFLALRGAGTHGLRYLREALDRGARAVLWDPDGAPSETESAGIAPAGVFVARVVGLKALVGRIADRFFNHPSSHLRVVGVTGTNGKTTCAYLMTQALTLLNCDAAYIGTLGWGRLGALRTPTHTTPDVVTLHRQLAELRDQGVRDVAMEVSSHALDQGRTDAVRFHSAAFTNLTRDHLDYHGSMEAYGAAKAKLLGLPGLRHLVINVGDEFGRDFARDYAGSAPLTRVWVGGAIADPSRSLHADEVQLTFRGMSLSLAGSFGGCRLTTRLLGRFNVENALIVVACLLGFDVPLSDAAGTLGRCQAPPGRMEVVDPEREAKPIAVVDYAHTPDALAKALGALREHCSGTLWCVFGCGGDRDPGKRRMMGAIADELADRIIVTDDNPRSENPQRITDAILEGIQAHGVRVIHDRGAAIAAALGDAVPGDLVLIAGKGHEDYQIYGDVRRRFSDRETALRCLGAAA